jgi:hypothetical protein
VAGTPPEICDRRTDGGLGQHPQPERQRGRRNVEPPLDRQRGRDRGKVILGELPVRVAPPVRPVPQWRQQPEVLPVAKHPGRHAEPRGGLSDPHAYQSNILLSKKGSSACAALPRSRTVVYGMRQSIKR